MVQDQALFLTKPVLRKGKFVLIQIVQMLCSIWIFVLTSVVSLMCRRCWYWCCCFRYCCTLDRLHSLRDVGMKECHLIVGDGLSKPYRVDQVIIFDHSLEQSLLGVSVYYHVYEVVTVGKRK